MIGTDNQTPEANNKSSWRNRLARSTVNREVVGSIPTEDVFYVIQFASKNLSLNRSSYQSEF